MAKGTQITAYGVHNEIMGVMKASDDAGKKGFIESADVTDGLNIWKQLQATHLEKVKMAGDPLVAARRAKALAAVLLDKKEAAEEKVKLAAAKVDAGGGAAEAVETPEQRMKRRAKEKRKEAVSSPARSRSKSKTKAVAKLSSSAEADKEDLPDVTKIKAMANLEDGDSSGNAAVDVVTKHASPTRGRSKSKTAGIGSDDERTKAEMKAEIKPKKGAKSKSPARKSSSSVSPPPGPEAKKKKSKSPERRSKSPERRASASSPEHVKAPGPKRKTVKFNPDPFYESTARARLRKGLSAIDEVAVYRHSLGKKQRKEQTEAMDVAYQKQLEVDLVNGFPIFQHSLSKDKETGRHVANKRMALHVRMSEDHDSLVFTKGEVAKRKTGQSLRVKFTQITKVHFGPVLPALRTREDPFLDPESTCCSIVLKSGVSMDLSFETSGGSLALVCVTKAKAGENCGKVPWKHLAGLRWHVARMQARNLAMRKHCSRVKILVSVIEESAKSFDRELRESYGSSLAEYCQWKHERGTPAAVHLARSSVDMVGADFSLTLALAQGLLLSEAVFNLPLEHVLALLDKPLSNEDKPHLRKAAAILNQHVLHDAEHKHSKEKKKLEKKQDAMRSMKPEVKQKQIDDLEAKQSHELDTELIRLQEKSLLWVLEVKYKAPRPLEIFCHKDRRYVELFTRVLRYFAGAVFPPVWESHSLEVQDLLEFVRATPRPERRPLQDTPVFPAGSSLRMWRSAVRYPPIFAIELDHD